MEAPNISEDLAVVEVPVGMAAVEALQMVAVRAEDMAATLLVVQAVLLVMALIKVCRVRNLQAATVVMAMVARADINTQEGLAVQAIPVVVVGSAAAVAVGTGLMAQETAAVTAKMIS